MPRQRRKLTVEDRVAIDLRRKDGWGVRAIARELGRSPSVISAEIARGGDPAGASGRKGAPGQVGTPGEAHSGQPSVCRCYEVPPAAMVAGADCGATSAPGDGDRGVIGAESVARGDLSSDLCPAAPCRAANSGANWLPACAKASLTAAGGQPRTSGVAGSAT